MHLAQLIALRLLPLLLVLGASGQQLSQTNQKHEAPANVFVGDQTLFAIRTRLGPFSPAERASTASSRLAALVKDVSVSPEAVGVVEHETSTDIVAGDRIIATVTEPDAKAARLPRSGLANEYVRQIRAGLAKVRAEYSYESLLLDILYAALSTVVLIAVLIVLSRLAPVIYKTIEQWAGTHIRTVRIQSLELIPAARITRILVQSARLGRIAFTLLIFHFYIPLVFSFFPWTRDFGNSLIGYILAPIQAGWAAFVSYLPSLLVVLVVLGCTYVAIRIARFIFSELERGTISWPGFYRESAMPTNRIVEVLILAFALVIMFPYLPGSNSPAFRGVSIFLGILFSLGSTSAIGNVVAGVILTYARGFRVGDRVKIADTVGDVIEKTLLATHVLTIKNVHITIPNSLVLGSHIINFSASAEGQALILHTSVTIGYDAPWRQIHALLISAAGRTPGILQEPKPFVFQTSLNDFYVSYEINAYTKEPNRMDDIYSDLHQNIQDAFNEAGVEIMSPHYSALRDGNATAIPGEYLPSDYKAPGFKISRGLANLKASDGIGTKE